MIKLLRTERVTRLSHVETPVSLIEANWTLTVRRQEQGGGWSYRAPTSVVVDGLPPVRIHDYVMLARLGALTATAAMLLRTIISRKKA